MILEALRVECPVCKLVLLEAHDVGQRNKWDLLRFLLQCGQGYAEAHALEARHAPVRLRETWTEEKEVRVAREGGIARATDIGVGGGA